MKLIVEFTEYPHIQGISSWGMQLLAAPRLSEPDAIGEILDPQQDATTLTERAARFDWLSRKLAPLIEGLLSRMPADLPSLIKDLESPAPTAPQ